MSTMAMWQFTLVDGRQILAPPGSVVAWLLPGTPGSLEHTVYFRWGPERCEIEPGTLADLYDAAGLVVIEVEVASGRVGFPLAQIVGLEHALGGTRVFLGTSGQVALSALEPTASLLARMEQAAQARARRAALAQPFAAGNGPRGIT